MPAAGAYSLQLWLRDEAGNEAPSSAVTVPLRFDDVAPSIAFAASPAGAAPEQLRADVADAHSGPAAGTIFYRRADSQRWIELATKLLAGEAGNAHLLAPMPDLGPGTYLFRAEAADAAGNTASPRCAPTAPRWRSAGSRRPRSPGRRPVSSPGCAAVTAAATR